MFIYDIGKTEDPGWPNWIANSFMTYHPIDFDIDKRQSSLLVIN